MFNALLYVCVCVCAGTSCLPGITDIIGAESAIFIFFAEVHTVQVQMKEAGGWAKR